jgi:hypothetical protein
MGLGNQPNHRRIPKRLLKRNGKIKVVTKVGLKNLPEDISMGSFSDDPVNVSERRGSVRMTMLYDELRGG